MKTHTIKEQIVEIIGFGLEPERAELKAQQILDLYIVRQIELLKGFQDYYQSDKFDDERTFDWNVGKFIEAFNAEAMKCSCGKPCKIPLCFECFNKGLERKSEVAVADTTTINKLNINKLTITSDGKETRRLRT